MHNMTLRLSELEAQCLQSLNPPMVCVLNSEDGALQTQTCMHFVKCGTLPPVAEHQSYGFMFYHWGIFSSSYDCDTTHVRHVL